MGNLRQKRWLFRMYDQDGVYVGNLNDTDFIEIPLFNIALGDGVSEIRLTSTFRYFDWNYDQTGLLTANTYNTVPEGYTGRTVQGDRGDQRIFNATFIGNLAKLFFIVDDQEVQVWSGVYSGIELSYDDGGRETFVHVFTPNTHRLATRVFRDGSNTRITYIDADPSDIFRDIVDNADVGINYDEDSLKDTGVLRSYIFNIQYAIDCLKAVIRLAPYNWVWYVGGDDLLYLFNIDLHGVNHDIPHQKLISMRFEKSIVYIRNRVLFLGGGDTPPYSQHDSSGSQNAWGIYEQVIQDSSVDDSGTAEDIAHRYLQEYASGRNYFTVEISGDDYDIDSVRPGDTITLQTPISDFAYLTWGNFTWSVDTWKYDFYATAGIPGIIQRITHKFNSIVCECSFSYEQYSERIQNIQKELDKVKVEAAPDAPTI